MSDLYLYIYDLTKGMARQFSPMFLGKQIDGVWHTGVVCYGEEWFFGNDGINSCLPKGTILGEPNQILHLGRTELTQDEFFEVVRQMSESSYRIGTYNLLEHNCNNFSNDLALILVGKSIPSYIIDLPKEILNTAIGPMLRPLLEQAADPMHTNGELRIPRYLNNQQNQQLKQSERTLPSTAILFQPDFNEEFTALINECESKLNQEQKVLLNELKENAQKSEIQIETNHIKLLYDLYLVHLKETVHLEMVLKLFQKISLNKSLAESIVGHEILLKEFIPRIKNLDANLKINSLRKLSNICSHLQISKQLIEKHQDLLFKEFSDFILTEPSSETELDLHEACISFFYNLIVAFELDAHLNDSNALTLGVALLERMPKLKLKPKSIYQTLALLRSCLAVSRDMKDLAVSMDFDLSKYQLTQIEKETFETKEANAASNEARSLFKTDSYDTVLNKVDKILHQK